MSFDPQTREEAIKAWQDANYNRCCSCHVNPPCSFCAEGFSLQLDEYLELYGFNDLDPEQEKIKAYDDAMTVI